MRLVDAPSPGWYPDPERRSKLRWWEGDDWSDDYRPVPSSAVMARLEAAAEEPEPTERPWVNDTAPVVDASEIAAQVRSATRREVDRAAREISQSVEASIARAKPALLAFIAKVLRWVRIGVITAAVLVIAWFVIQFIAQATFLSWLGDRIDNITS